MRNPPKKQPKNSGRKKTGDPVGPPDTRRAAPAARECRAYSFNPSALATPAA